MIKLKPDNVSAARYTAVMGLLFAVSAVLNSIESIFSAFLPAGVRIGLANIVIMAAILCINLPSAALLVILKAAFVFLARGFSAAAMSLCGGVLAFAATAILFRRTKASYILISVLGAIAHSLGQLTAARFILGTNAIFAYTPVLAIGSTAAGICTGIVLKAVFPQIEKILKKQNKLHKSLPKEDSHEQA